VSETDDRGQPVLETWRQGDCVLGEQWFAYRIDPANPATEAGQIAAANGADLAEALVVGLVVTSQTCDIVRVDPESPFVEISPLVSVSDPEHDEIARRIRPRYAVVPALAKDRLVADLGRTMTVEKAVVATWDRVPGWTEDNEARDFAEPLARKRARPAFPDDFVHLVGGLQARIKEKHNRNSPEGAALRSLREIRVQATPSWRGAPVRLHFWFISREPKAEPGLEQSVEEWLKRVQPTGRFMSIDGQAVNLSEITAQEYVDSDRLDLDWLSATRA
jgi:hypothetical protein